MRREKNYPCCGPHPPQNHVEEEPLDPFLGVSSLREVQSSRTRRTAWSKGSSETQPGGKASGVYEILPLWPISDLGGPRLDWGYGLSRGMACLEDPCGSLVSPARDTRESELEASCSLSRRPTHVPKLKGEHESDGRGGVRVWPVTDAVVKMRVLLVSLPLFFHAGR